MDSHFWFGDPRLRIAAVWFALGMLAGFLLTLASCAPDGVVPPSTGCPTPTVTHVTGRIAPLT